MKDKKIITDLLGDEFAQQIISELQLKDDSPEVQAEFISMLGETVLQKVVLEILKVLPDTEAKQFEDLIGGGDMDGMRKLVEPHIPDLDGFINHQVMREYEAIKTKIHMTEQGVE